MVLNSYKCKIKIYNMIKSFKLIEIPEMNKYTDMDILSNLNPMFKVPDKESVKYTIDGADSRVDSYFSYDPSIFIDVFRSTSNKSFDLIYESYNNIQEADPSLIKVIRTKGNNEDSDELLIVAYPRYINNVFSNIVYSNMLDELSRVSAFLNKKIVNRETVLDFLRDYIKVCVCK